MDLSLVPVIRATWVCSMDSSVTVSFRFRILKLKFYRIFDKDPSTTEERFGNCSQICPRSCRSACWRAASRRTEQYSERYSR